jgi:hypothetical protein
LTRPENAVIIKHKSDTDSTMNSSLYTEMGFDDWCKLASDDPGAFENARRTVIEEFLASAPLHSRERLRGLQWRIDTVRERSSTPMAACLDIYTMMWDKLAGENGMIETLQAIEKPYLPGKGRPSAQILAFRPPVTRPR